LIFFKWIHDTFSNKV